MDLILFLSYVCWTDNDVYDAWYARSTEKKQVHDEKLFRGF